MHQAHGIGYEEYSKKLSKLIEVEQKREEDYQKSLEIVAEIDRNSR
ncbi:hypothetical protein [Sutcliffiella rhizosphaerae]|uniref:Uncharacterized protein n=1 Tax=Sutcliffiella rhizosphaerae TaxID=2880967 RepID=A0ABN8ADM7_9BACI|nr:hypothetical protein [Sutcliffiella rhizosphaerae]CAG9620830.1 hypothetical protein BACCIP111883_01601 [Sutcliffiella rhizosphaerae]